MTEDKYYCRICGTEIDKERFEDHEGLCDFCEQNEEDDEDEDFGIAPHY
jgi:CRISPR/Cas system-associated protein Cas10 (large subunit of type III CRISPR-Cas system)